ncbi:MAG: metal-dependent phosphohydrolase [Planctomycetota bacterium]|nr:MAG: metal-dependent phosphohydrolase [Planctomycetota bacterium]
MLHIHRESLIHDPIHGYIPFVSIADAGETSERMLLDHPWLQRLRQIHQLQTAWWVYPSAEHTRFQHVVGTMHMASRAVAALYDSLKDVCPDAPSRGFVECTMRLAALLHDVGHGPFGHFFDAHFLTDYRAPDGSRLNHEKLGGHIIRSELGELLRGVRRCPSHELAAGEQIEPDQIAWLITRPTEHDQAAHPRWLALLRSLFCGLYTVDNMDFVLRDAFMSGYSTRAYDLDRLLRYSFFSERGLTIHHRGLNALLRFMQTKSELFRAVYFHRTVRAIDKTLEGLFRDSKRLLFPGNPLEHLSEYQRFTEWSLLVGVARWPASDDPQQRELGLRWQRLLQRQVDWETVYERNLTFAAGEAEQTSIFSDPAIVEQAIRGLLPAEVHGVEMQIDLPRHIYRPHEGKATARQNFLCSPGGATRRLDDDQLFRQLPVAHRMCRVYLRKSPPREHVAAIAAAMDQLVGGGGEDDLTNM